MKLIWSPLSMKRVREIARYIGRDRPGAAADWADAIFASAQRLRQFAESGRGLPESQVGVGTALREVLYGDYRVIYRIDPDGVRILTVRHARQHLRFDDPDLV